MHSSTAGNPADTPPILLSGHCDQCFVFQVSAPQALFEPAPVAFKPTPYGGLLPVVGRALI